MLEMNMYKTVIKYMFQVNIGKIYFFPKEKIKSVTRKFTKKLAATTDRKKIDKDQELLKWKM